MDDWDEDSESSWKVCGLKQVSGIHCYLPGIEIKNHPKSVCNGSFHQNKPCSLLSQILTYRTPYIMCIDAKTARYWKYLPTDTQVDFPPGSTFQPNRKVVATSLSFINTLCSRFERTNGKQQQSLHNTVKGTVWIFFSWRSWSTWTPVPNTKSLWVKKPYHR